MHFTGLAPDLAARADEAIGSPPGRRSGVARLEDEVHGSPDAAAVTSIASGLEDGCQAPERADGQGAASLVRLGQLQLG